MTVSSSPASRPSEIRPKYTHGPVETDDKGLSMGVRLGGWGGGPARRAEGSGPRCKPPAGPSSLDLTPRVPPRREQRASPQACAEKATHLGGKVDESAKDDVILSLVLSFCL